MPLTRNRRGARLTTRKEFRIDIEDVKKGVNTLVSESRLEKDQAKELQNMWLIEDGVPDKRPGTAAYGTVTYSAQPDGAAEYTTTAGARELVVVADGTAYVQTLTTKTQIPGTYSFTQGTRCSFWQYNDYLYICNGTNALARYDGSSITTYTAMSAPVWDGTPIARTVLTAGSYNNYYRVSAVNSIGQTTATATSPATFTTNLARDDWSATSYLTLGWADVVGATKYIIYYGDTEGFETYLSESTVSTYVDDGSAVSNPYLEYTTEDTTTGPKFRSIAVSKNRLWGTSDPDNPWRVHFSGTGVNKGNFAPGYGGGYVDLELGGRERTIAVTDYQGIPHIFTQTAEGRGAIWSVEFETYTIESTSFQVPVPLKVIGNTGCSSTRGLVRVENDILFVNKQGVFVLGNEPGIQDTLRTNELSSTIRPDWRSLDGGSLDEIATYYYQARVYFAVPKASGQPDTIYVFDRERAAWIKDWTLGVSQFLEFTDSAGATHFLGIAATKLIEFDPAFESDSGTAFTWRYKSGRLALDKEWHKFGRVNKAYIRLRNASGTVDVSLTGIGISNQYSTTGESSVTVGASNAGLGWDEFGAVMFGDTDGTPTVFASESLIKYLTIEHNKNIIRDLQWTVSGDSTNDRAVITGLAVVGKESNVPLALSDKI